MDCEEERFEVGEKLGFALALPLYRSNIPLGRFLSRFHYFTNTIYGNGNINFAAFLVNLDL